MESFLHTATNTECSGLLYSKKPPIKILKNTTKKFEIMIDKSKRIRYTILVADIQRWIAEVAELADAHGSGPCGSNTMRVQVSSSARAKEVFSDFLF